MALENLDALNDEQLLALKERTDAAVENRRRGFSLDRIKPGMSAEDLAHAKKEVYRVLKGLGN